MKRQALTNYEVFHESGLRKDGAADLWRMQVAVNTDAGSEGAETICLGDALTIGFTNCLRSACLGIAGGNTRSRALAKPAGWEDFTIALNAPALLNSDVSRLYRAALQAALTRPDDEELQLEDDACPLFADLLRQNWVIMDSKADGYKRLVIYFEHIGMLGSVPFQLTSANHTRAFVREEAIPVVDMGGSTVNRLLVRPRLTTAAPTAPSSGSASAAAFHAVDSGRSLQLEQPFDLCSVPQATAIGGEAISDAIIDFVCDVAVKQLPLRGMTAESKRSAFLSSFHAVQLRVVDVHAQKRAWSRGADLFVPLHRIEAWLVTSGLPLEVAPGQHPDQAAREAVKESVNKWKRAPTSDDADGVTLSRLQPQLIISARVAERLFDSVLGVICDETRDYFRVNTKVPATKRAPVRRIFMHGMSMENEDVLRTVSQAAEAGTFEGPAAAMDADRHTFPDANNVVRGTAVAVSCASAEEQLWHETARAYVVGVEHDAHDLLGWEHPVMRSLRVTNLPHFLEIVAAAAEAAARTDARGKRNRNPAVAFGIPLLDKGEWIHATERRPCSALLSAPPGSTSAALFLYEAHEASALPVDAPDGTIFARQLFVEPEDARHPKLSRLSIRPIPAHPLSKLTMTLTKPSGSSAAAGVASKRSGTGSSSRSRGAAPAGASGAGATARDNTEQASTHSPLSGEFGLPHVTFDPARGVTLGAVAGPSVVASVASAGALPPFVKYRGIRAEPFLAYLDSLKRAAADDESLRALREYVQQMACDIAAGDAPRHYRQARGGRGAAGAAGSSPEDAGQSHGGGSRSRQGSGVRSSTPPAFASRGRGGTDDTDEGELASSAFGGRSRGRVGTDDTDEDELASSAFAGRSVGNKRRLSDTDGSAASASPDSKRVAAGGRRPSR